MNTPTVFQVDQLASPMGAPPQGLSPRPIGRNVYGAVHLIQGLPAQDGRVVSGGVEADPFGQVMHVRVQLACRGEPFQMGVWRFSQA